MTRLVSLIACLGLTVVALPPASAASSAASSASDSASTSVGSVSTSIQRSSDSSSRTGGVAAGPYRVIDVAGVPERADTLRVALRPVAEAVAAADARDDGLLVLLLPRPAAERGGLAAGEVVLARHRPYGVEFARADNGEAFFLVLHDEWHRELPSHPVAL